jgi:hypothetical protein
MVEFIPVKSLPYSGYPKNVEEKWFQLDSEESYKVKGNYLLFDKIPISYKFNSFGYRCPEFTETAAIKILSIGCSYVLGLGLPSDLLFHEKFAKRLRDESSLSVVNWNLGQSGASNDYISRIANLAIPVLNPDIVLVNFTRFARREYVAPHRKLVRYSPTFFPPDPVAQEIYGHFFALSSPFDDEVNFYRNYKSIESLLRDRIWLYSFIAREEMEGFKEHLDHDRCVCSFEAVDKARDNLHPGIESHNLVYEKFWEKFVDLYGLQRVSTSIRQRSA